MENSQYSLDDLIKKSNEIKEKIKMLEEKQDSLYNALNRSNSEDNYKETRKEIGKIYNEIRELDNIDFELQEKIFELSPPVKQGNLIDLKIRGYVYYIVLHNESKIVGKIDYRAYHCNGYIGDIGYSIDEEYRNKGFATEALSLLSELLFEKGVPDFWVSCNKYNFASKRVIEKNGGKIIKDEKDYVLFECQTCRRETLDNSTPSK